MCGHHCAGPPAPASVPARISASRGVLCSTVGHRRTRVHRPGQHARQKRWQYCRTREHHRRQCASHKCSPHHRLRVQQRRRLPQTSRQPCGLRSCFCRNSKGLALTASTSNLCPARRFRALVLTREWPQSAVQVQVARASLFAAQAIALDMIAAGRKKEVDQILEHVAAIVPDVAPEPTAEETTGAEKPGSRRGNA